MKEFAAESFKQISEQSVSKEGGGYDYDMRAAINNSKHRSLQWQKRLELPDSPMVNMDLKPTMDSEKAPNMKYLSRKSLKLKTTFCKIIHRLSSIKVEDPHEIKSENNLKIRGILTPLEHNKEDLKQQIFGFEVKNEKYDINTSSEDELKTIKRMNQAALLENVEFNSDNKSDQTSEQKYFEIPEGQPIINQTSIERIELPVSNLPIRRSTFSGLPKIQTHEK